MDDSHGVAAYGATGRGTEEHCKARVDIFIGTFGKAFGVNGGFVAGEPQLIEAVRQKADTYIYTNPLGAADCAAAVSAVDIADGPEGQERLANLKARTRQFRDGLQSLGFESIRASPGRAAAGARYRCDARHGCAASSNGASSPWASRSRSSREGTKQSASRSTPRTPRPISASAGALKALKRPPMNIGWVRTSGCSHRLRRHAVALSAQTAITTPKEQFGFNVGDDYQLANYTQIARLLEKARRANPTGMTLQEIGKTAEGRPQLMAIVTSPANHAKLANATSDISQPARVGRRRLTDAEAQRLAKEGKAVVWIDGGLHATETLGAQQLVEMVYQMVSRTDEETMRFLDDCIVLFVHANPDGNELVADWYMRNPDPEQAQR